VGLKTHRKKMNMADMLHGGYCGSALAFESSTRMFLERKERRESKRRKM
jgi:hypothetical protein